MTTTTTLRRFGESSQRDASSQRTGIQSADAKGIQASSAKAAKRAFLPLFGKAPKSDQRKLAPAAPLDARARAKRPYLHRVISISFRDARDTMAMPLAPGAAVPAGAGDLAVAAAFAAGADSEIGEPRGDRSDSSSVSSSDDERGDDGDEPVAEPSRGRPTADGPAPEFEFSDEETRRAIPGVIRDGSDSSEWSDSSDDEDVEELDLANMPKWLEDIKNNVKTDFDDDAAHAEPPRTKNEIAADAVPPPPPPPPVGPDEALVAVGDVISVVGDVVVVQSLPGIEPMDEESVLCLETRKGLGAIEEVFGPVAAPLYAMRMPAARQTGDVVEKNGDDAKDDDAKDDRDDRDRYVSSLDVKVGTRVFAVEGRRRALDTRGLRTKGYDNSGQNDEEVADDEEFSDDEREAEAKRKRKQKKRGA
jgi:H/ACA ribonucleoprotein complex non-core subunit NAF1